jgi:hypothetical protein
MKKWIIGILIVFILAASYYLFPESRLPENKKIDRLVVIKSRRIMNAYSQNQLIKTYNILSDKIRKVTKNLKVIKKHRKENIPSMTKIQTAASIKIWVYPIQIAQTEKKQKEKTLSQEERSRSTD